MPRYRIKYTENKIKKLIHEGRGQGEGKDYIPWIKVGEFSSKGRSHRIYGIKTDRIHHLLSDLEYNYFNNLMWQDNIIDIREQFPLFPVNNTENIAKEIGVKHPKYIGLQNSMVMTTDFLITEKNDNNTILKARSVKYQNELSNTRTKEKLAIESLYWEAKGIEWSIVTEKSFDIEKSKRIKFLLGYYNYQLDSINSQKKSHLIQDLIQFLNAHRNENVKELCLFLDRQNKMNEGSFLSLFHHLSARKYIPINIEVSFNASIKVEEYINMDKMGEIMFKGVKNFAVS